MKISDLIEHLENFKDKQGDLEVETWNRGVVDVKDPNFCTGYIYRVKPKTRPFESEDECFFEMKKHEPIGWVKIDETYKSIASLQEKYLYLNGENSLRHYSTLFRDATFADGQPFGFKIEG